MRVALALSILFVLAACGSSTPDASQPGPASTSVPATTSVGDTAAATSTSIQPEPAEEDLVAFIATLEEQLAGTAYEGQALSEPDLFVATGRLFCEMLDRGDTVDEVLTSYLDELAGGVELATEDDLELAGSLLGSAVGAICPEHGDLVG